MITGTNSLAPNAHEAVSRYIQLHATRGGLTHLRWTGRTQEDVEMLVNDSVKKNALSQLLWNGMKELLELNSLHELPEPIQAQIVSTILKAQANFELGMKERAAKNEGAT